MVYGLTYVSAATELLAPDEITDILAVSRRNNLVLGDGPQESRRVEGWSMALRDLGAVDPATTPGFSPFLHTPLTEASFGADPSLAQRLLLTFRDQTWPDRT